ncbi:hypothetical protein KEJ27_05800 [Candidatus Bathyarchaeota archaeon]|nr:hypothetical protein [Candidatus Bathyarchaeota archaeon]MBS7613152.1 hypothetical protein [Candidatus Bathyarchaeota archaeon]
MSVKSFVKALHSLIMEAIIFISGVRSAEVNSNAAVSLAGECVKLVSEAIGNLVNVEEKDEHVEKALKELENAKELFKSVITGERSTDTVRKCISYGVENRNIFILDLAHSHIHKAIDLLKKSRNCEVYRDVLELLTIARRESAPTTLYRLAYEMSRKTTFEK